MDITLGLLYMLLGAICGGSFGLPSKYAKDTPWENLWGPFFLFVTIGIPVALGPVIVDGFFGIYSSIGIAALAAALIFGFLWGLGSMALGMSFAFIGLSLAYALNYGAQIAFGSVGAMLIHSPDKILTSQGQVVLLGVVVCLVGVVVSGRAGILKGKSTEEDKSVEKEAEKGAKKPKMLIGLIIGIVSGVLCACYSVAYGFTGPVSKAAEALGNSSVQTACAVTAIILWGGALSACGYCVYLLFKNKTWGAFRKPGIGLVLFLALIMAFLHDGAIFFYALGAEKLGDLGGSVGYAIFMSFAIIVGNVHGFRTGEWKGASKQSINWIIAGIAILVLGVCVLGFANSMPAAEAVEAVVEATP